VSVELRVLKTLIAIVDHGGFAAAGNAIGLTQSAVSLHVKALEEELGESLFDRSKRPPRLNSRGAAVVDRAREIVRLASELSGSGDVDSLRGVLNLGAIPTVLSGLLPEALATMQARYPDIMIRLTSGLSAELAPRVTSAELDVALLSEPPHVAQGLAWRAFTREPLVVIAPAGARGKSDRELLETHTFIRFQRFAWAGQLIDENLKERSIRVRQGMEVDTLEGVALLVAHGLGVSIVPRRRIAQPFPPDVVTVPFGQPPVERVLGLLTQAVNPKVHLVDALHQILGDLAGTGDCIDNV
jgi:DNA-binding transcriptional LysR family regulator